MVNLINVSSRLAPPVPTEAFNLNPFDRKYNKILNHLSNLFFS